LSACALAILFTSDRALFLAHPICKSQISAWTERTCALDCGTDLNGAWSISSTFTSGPTYITTMAEPETKKEMTEDYKPKNILLTGGAGEMHFVACVEVTL